MDERNIFIRRNLFNDNIKPKKEWNNININNEKELQYFLNNNIWWVSNIIKKMFKFSSLDYLGMEYTVYKNDDRRYRKHNRYDMAFQHGEDIVIVELKYDSGAKTNKAYEQLKDYVKCFKQNYDNNVYKVLITTHLTNKTYKSFATDKDETGIILLEQNMNNILFNETLFGVVGG